MRVTSDTILRTRPICSRLFLCTWPWMREKSFRQMKEEGARWAAAQKAPAISSAKIDHAA